MPVTCPLPGPSNRAGAAGREPVTEALARLAEHHGIAASYRDADDRVRRPPDDTLRALLTSLEVPCSDADEVEASLRAAELEPWRRGVPPTVTVRVGDRGPVPVTIKSGAAATLTRQDGSVETLAVRSGVEQRTVEGSTRVRGSVELPADLPPGVHGLEVGDDHGHLLVAPRRCPLPPRRGWGWQAQLYAMRSLQSWGIGDFGDLSQLVHDAGRRGADFVLLNPLHAALPVVPQADSPYSPASRRAWNPLYLRPERCDGWDSARGADRELLQECQASGHALDVAPLLDRDAVFAVKDQALRVLSAQRLPRDRQERFDAFVVEGGQALEDLVAAQALASRHGGGMATWPPALRERQPAALTAAREELAAELHHQRWLQWQCSEQLAAAQADARRAGMGVGLLTDLAVGVDGDGADAWAQADVLALDVHVGAPPDAFAQRGQDWGLPPPRPDRLAATGYRPLRELVRANLRHAGGLRIDHVMGLFRLFWIPAGAPPTEGTYVRYDAEAMLGAVVLEADRAGAVVVGEDLGTVEEGVRETLADRGILGSAVFYYERRGDRPAGAREYRELALTSVTTHDLPTAAAWLTDEPTRLRQATGQLAVPPAEDRLRRRTERQELLDLLVAEGLLDEPARGDSAAVVDAIHEFVAATPSLLVAAAPGDAVGDPRQPNLPGTGGDAHPNWRLPLAVPDPQGFTLGGLLPPATPLPLEEWLADPRVAALAATLARHRPRPA